MDRHKTQNAGQVSLACRSATINSHGPPAMAVSSTWMRGSQCRERHAEAALRGSGGLAACRLGLENRPSYTALNRIPILRRECSTFGPRSIERNLRRPCQSFVAVEQPQSDETRTFIPPQHSVAVPRRFHTAYDVGFRAHHIRRECGESRERSRTAKPGNWEAGASMND